MNLEEILDSSKDRQISDIHFLPKKDHVLLCFREEGGIEVIHRYSLEMYALLIQKIKVLGRLNISEKRLPQDGAFEYQDQSFRVSFLKSVYGESLVIRKFDRCFRSLFATGLSIPLCERLLKRIECVRGIHLIAGETGMGKTTTFYGLLKELTDLKYKVLTIEDPVENYVEDLVQCQINSFSGFTYERAVFAALRQDPDYIAIGEIRNEETARMALRAALTGHPVISTIHAFSYKSAYEKLKEFGLQKDELTMLLSTVFYQKLVFERGGKKAYGKLETNPEETKLQQGAVFL
jgi:type II secretory ATPase GspE/PulE/Tfp pilus assembly ATPase PilB-like protein